MEELVKAKEKNCQIIQIFVDPFVKNKTVYEDIKKFLVQNNMMCVVHASYTINLAKSWDEYSWWIKQFILEIEASSIVGAFGIVVHLGKQLNLSKEEATNNMFSSLLYCHNKTRTDYNSVKILLETSSGQGSEMCYKLEDFSHFFKKLKFNNNTADRFRICLDTCHIFAAGYDIRSVNAVNMYLDTFEELIGIKYIALLHLNDSKTELGSNVDRHEDIGKGKIGKVGLLYFAKIIAKFNIPIVLETPHDAQDETIVSEALFEDSEKIEK